MTSFFLLYIRLDLVPGVFRLVPFRHVCAEYADLPFDLPAHAQTIDKVNANVVNVVNNPYIVVNEELSCLILFYNKIIVTFRLFP